MDFVSKYTDRWLKVGVLQPVVLGVTLYLTYDAYQWASRFAETTERGGAEVALMVAAVIAPISVLQGWVFKQFIQSCHHKVEGDNAAVS